PDFPLHTYAQRGPLIAWTPHLAGVALKLDNKSKEMPASPSMRSSRGPRIALVCLLLLLIGLLAINLWSTLMLHRSRAAVPAPGPSPGGTGPAPRGKQPTPADDASRERFVAALHKLLIEQGGGREWDADRERLLARYEQLIRTHKDLRVRDSVQDKVTV